MERKFRLPSIDRKTATLGLAVILTIAAASSFFGPKIASAYHEATTFHLDHDPCTQAGNVTTGMITLENQKLNLYCLCPKAKTSNNYTSSPDYTYSILPLTWASVPIHNEEKLEVTIKPSSIEWLLVYDPSFIRERESQKMIFSECSSR